VLDECGYITLFSFAVFPILSRCLIAFTLNFVSRIRSGAHTVNVLWYVACSILLYSTSRGE